MPRNLLQEQGLLTPEQQQQLIAGPQGEAPVTAGGTAKSIATGVRGGVEALGGAAGDIRDYGMSKIAKLAQALGAGPDVMDAIMKYGRYTSPFMFAPTSGEVGAGTDYGVEKLPEAVSAPVQDVTRHAPQNTTEEWAQTGGSFLPSALIPGGPLARAARVAIPTAAVEGTGQLTRQLAPEWEDTARFVAGLVAGGGAEMAANSFRLKSALSRLNTTKGGVQRVQELLTEQGMTVDDAAAALQELQPGGMLLDVGADTGGVLRQEAQRIQARGGPGRAELEGPLRTRHEGLNDALESEVRSAVGPRQQPLMVTEALTERLKETGKKYPAAKRNQSRPSNLQGIADELDSEIVSARGDMKSKLQSVRDMLDLPGAKGNLDPSAEGVHAMRIELDNMIAAAEPGSPTFNRLSDYRKKIDAELKDISPDIKALDAEYSQTKKEQDAFQTGQEIYENPRGAPTEVEFRQAFDAMSPGERARVLDGLNVETWRQLGIKANDLTTLKSLIKGEGKWNQQKVAAVIGEDRARGLMDAISRAKIFDESYRKIVQGSKTAESQTPANGSVVKDALKAGTDVAAAAYLGGPGAAAGVAGARLKDWLLSKRSGLSPELDREVGRLLASSRADDLVAASRLIASRGSSMPPAVLGALLSRQQELSDRKEGLR